MNKDKIVKYCKHKKFNFKTDMDTTLNIKNYEIKAKIDLAESVEDADKILEKEFPNSVEKKYAFLQKTYNCTVSYASNGKMDDIQENYIPVLTAIKSIRIA